MLPIHFDNTDSATIYYRLQEIALEEQTFQLGHKNIFLTQQLFDSLKEFIYQEHLSSYLTTNFRKRPYLLFGWEIHIHEESDSANIAYLA
ncbi:hypothetical protein EP331_14110 [bacterium]|nr:MAG: hypothetical protein EP331_14110 [bacterium]